MFGKPSLSFRNSYSAFGFFGFLAGFVFPARSAKPAPSDAARVAERLLSQPIPVRRRSRLPDRGSYAQLYMERFKNEYRIRHRGTYVGEPGSREKREHDPRRSARNQTRPRSHVR